MAATLGRFEAQHSQHVADENAPTEFAEVDARHWSVSVSLGRRVVGLRPVRPVGTALKLEDDGSVHEPIE